MYQQKADNGNGSPPPWSIIIIAVIGLALVAALIASGQDNAPAQATRPAATSCTLSQPLVEDAMVSYLRAHARGDETQKEALRERVLPYTACAPGVHTALDIWLRAVDADNQQGMTTADERFILAFRQLRGK